jgi:hypothetical protein
MEVLTDIRFIGSNYPGVSAEFKINNILFSSQAVELLSGNHLDLY